MRIHALEDDLHLAVLGRELDRVRKQVPDHLLEPPRVSRYRTGRRVEELLDAYAFRVGGRRHRIDSRFHEAHRLYRLDVEAQLARRDPAHVEQVFDELRLHACVALDRLETLLQRGLLLELAPQDLRPAEDRAQRRAKLVRQGCEELVFHGAGALGLIACRTFAVEQLLALFGGFLGDLEKARVVDGHCALRGNAHHDALRARGENAGLGMAEEKAADHFA
jgi:hypothetical protein